MPISDDENRRGTLQRREFADVVIATHRMQLVNNYSSNSGSTMMAEYLSDTSSSSSDDVTDGGITENGPDSSSHENSPRHYSDITSEGDEIELEIAPGPLPTVIEPVAIKHIPMGKLSGDPIDSSSNEMGGTSEDEDVRVRKSDSRNKKAKASRARADTESDDDDYDENDENDEDCNQQLGDNEDDDMDDDDDDDDSYSDRKRRPKFENPQHITINLDSETCLSNASNFEIKVGTDKVYNIRRHDYSVHAGQILEIRCTDKSNQQNEYYVHYLGLNRRLDEWVKRHRISEYVMDHKRIDKVVPPTNQAPGESADQFYDRKITRNFSEMDQNSAQLEKEHESITKVKFINKAVIGHFEIEAWYFSPFPQEYAKVPTIYICEFCLKYMDLGTYGYHLHTCDKRGPPGRVVYCNGNLAIYKIDGEIVRNQLYCQLLCLMAKLFLDHKTLYYDVAPFDFYVLCETTESHSHIVGYFSKEKVSKENNVACILILPPYQRKGYGKLLIDFSYYLSRRNGEIGGPEKPLSDLGRLSYRSYWAYTLLKLMSECKETTLTIDDLSNGSGITKADIYYTLKSMKLIKYWKTKTVICVTRETIFHLLHLPQFKRPKLTIDHKKVDLGYTDGPSTSKNCFA